jgi:hypothetical protein
MSLLRPAHALVLAAALAPFGCRSRETPAPAPSASASAGPKPVPRAPSSALAPKPAPIGCRVLTVKGDAPGAPKAGDLLQGTAFFELPAGAELSVRHSETTRELALAGPGRFRACPKGEELVVVTRGKVKTTSGPGARAGAEVRLATPFGVVHFGDAELVLEVTDKLADLRVAQGTATIDGRTEADPGPTPKPVSGPKGRASFRGRSDPSTLIEECEKTSAGSGSGPRPATSAPGASIGQWAVDRLKARQAARHACSRALSAVGLVEGPEAARLWDQVAAKIVVTGSGPPEGPIPEK